MSSLCDHRSHCIAICYTDDVRGTHTALLIYPNYLLNVGYVEHNISPFIKLFKHHFSLCKPILVLYTVHIFHAMVAKVSNPMG